MTQVRIQGKPQTPRQFHQPFRPPVPHFISGVPTGRRFNANFMSTTSPFHTVYGKLKSKRFNSSMFYEFIGRLVVSATCGRTPGATRAPRKPRKPSGKPSPWQPNIWAALSNNILCWLASFLFLTCIFCVLFRVLSSEFCSVFWPPVPVRALCRYFGW